MKKLILLLIGMFFLSSSAGFAGIDSIVNPKEVINQKVNEEVSQTKKTLQHKSKEVRDTLKNSNPIPSTIDSIKKPTDPKTYQNIINK